VLIEGGDGRLTSTSSGILDIAVSSSLGETRSVWYNNDLQGAAYSSGVKNVIQNSFSSGGLRKLLVNFGGSTSDTPAARLATSGPVMLGRSIDGSFTTNGTIYEVLVFNSVLAEENRQYVEGYLAWKWGLNGLLPGAHPYKTNSPVSSSSLTPPSLPPWNPTTIQGNLLWLDGADQASLSETTWSDKSGNFFSSSNESPHIRLIVFLLPIVLFS
jgi:hypothetical protein